MGCLFFCFGCVFKRVAIGYGNMNSYTGLVCELIRCDCPFLLPVYTHVNMSAHTHTHNN